MKFIKAQLKSARKQLISGDYEGTVDTCDDILERDRNNYFAYLFKGKALSSMNNDKDAVKQYIKATKLEPDNELAWKGLVLISKQGSDYKNFFEDVLGLAKAMTAQDDNLRECANTIHEYMNKNRNASFKNKLNEYYYRQIIPGLSEIGDLFGPMIGNPPTYLARLITLLTQRENTTINEKVKKMKFRMPLHLTAANKRDLNKARYEIYEKSEIPELYDMLLGMNINDRLRAQYEEDLLKYNYNVLLCSPDKSKLYDKVKEMASDLVLVHTLSKFAYDMYFDWQDPVQLGDLDIRTIANYIKTFGINGLGAIFYGYVQSEISPYDLETVHEYLDLKKKGKGRNAKKSKKEKGKGRNKKRKNSKNDKGNGKNEKDTPSKEISDKEIHDNEKSEKEKHDKEEEPSSLDRNNEKQSTKDDEQNEDSDETDDKNDKTDEDTEDNGNSKLSPLPNDRVLDMMLEGIKNSRKSILAHRILIAFCIHIKEYQCALDNSSAYVKLTVDHYNETGTPLKNSRLHSLLDLAIIYTYHESPKNFSQAMTLYESVLKVDKNNVKAKVGEGLIFVENGDYQKAEKYLRDVVEEFPDHYEACQEYGWCLVHLGKYEEGRKLILRAYGMLTGDNASSLETRSVTLWRLGQSYLLDYKQRKDENSKSLVKQAVKYFVDSLKQSANYPPCYTSLGLIFSRIYGDEKRALKCFYKAFDLDPSELVSSYALVKYFSSKSDWEMVEVISSRVLDSESAKKLLVTRKAEDPSWPYRMVATFYMEKKDDANAIENYQNALRINPSDVQSWMGLGEAYLNGGRLEASRKVFLHVLDLAPNDWHARYMLSISTAELGEFEDSISQLRAIEDEGHKNEKCIITALYETLISKAKFEVGSGFINRSLDTILQAIKELHRASEIDISSQKLWKGVGEVMRLCIYVQSGSSKVPLDTLTDIFGKLDSDDYPAPEFVSEINEKDGLKDYDYSSNSTINNFHYMAVEAAKMALRTVPQDSVKPMRAGLLFNLGIEFMSWAQDSNSEKFRDCAIMTLKKSVQLENDNPEFWCCLGLASISRNARVSQHCLIKSLSLAPTGMLLWVDLGVLYLYYQDSQLAEQCFKKAQSLGPSNPEPWIGEALVNSVDGNNKQANRMFTHSYVLTNGRIPLSSILYGLSVVKKEVVAESKVPSLATLQEFNAAHFGLLNYLKFYPDDQLALELAATVVERTHSFDEGTKLSLRLCEILEDKYDKSKDPAVLPIYARVKAQLARLELGTANYKNAMDAADIASELLSQSGDLTEESQKCLLSSLAVTGLAWYFQNQYDKALVEFNKILEAFPDSKRVVVLVSQVLYAIGSEDTKQAAVEELFKNIENYGSSLLVVLTVAAISVVDNLSDYLPAVKEELEMMPNEAKMADTTDDAVYFIDLVNKRLAKDGQQNNEKVWQRAAFIFPSEVRIWQHLNSSVCLDVASKSEDVGASTLAEAYIKVGTLRTIQRGLFLDPSNVKGYKGLVGCLGN